MTRLQRLRGKGPLRTTISFRAISFYVFLPDPAVLMDVKVKRSLCLPAARVRQPAERINVRHHLGPWRTYANMEMGHARRPIRAATQRYRLIPLAAVIPSDFIVRVFTRRRSVTEDVMTNAAAARAGAYAARLVLARPLMPIKRPSSLRRQVMPLVTPPQVRHRRLLELSSRAIGPARRLFAS